MLVLKYLLTIVGGVFVGVRRRWWLTTFFCRRN